VTETANITDFSRLARLDDGKSKFHRAEIAIEALHKQIKGHFDFVEEEKEIERRRAESHDRLMQVSATKERLAELTTDYSTLLAPTIRNVEVFSWKEYLTVAI
jgi:hypothetical protein